MAQVTYVGRSSDGTFISVDGTTDTHVAHGETVDVPDELAAALLDQPREWATVDTAPDLTTPDPEPATAEED